ncbi:MAG TPA: hypothetical protein VN824_00250 [Puia sp.]|nr:hypothetical protein [Puia sp.]
MSYCLLGENPGSAPKADIGELLLDPAFRATVKLYSAPDKRSKPTLLRHKAAAEDWIYFKVQECNTA